MIHPTMQGALNAQINEEQYSAQLYLAMSGYMEGRSFRGFARWLKIQSEEETGHAERLIVHLLDRGGQLELKSVAAPPSAFGEPIALFEAVLEHERGISAKIGALYELAQSLKDHACEVALHWFISEQVEEESAATLILDRLRATGDKGGAVWYFDKELGKRTKG